MAQRQIIIAQQRQQQQQLAQQWAECQRLAEEIKVKQLQKSIKVLDSLQTCPLHNKLCEFIRIAPVESPSASFYQCQDCVDGLPQSEGQFLKISEILEDGQDTIFPNYPFIKNQHLIEQIKTYAIRRKNNLTWTAIIREYFQKIRQELCANVDQIEESVRGNVDSIEKIAEIVLSEYYQCSAKEQLKQVILDGQQEGQGGIEEKIKAIADNAIKNSGKKENMLSSLVLNLGQREETIDFENSDKIQRLSMHCLSLMKVFREEQVEKEEVKEDVKLPGEEGKSIEVINSLLLAVTKELKKTQRPSEVFQERVKYEIDMFSNKMNGYLERDSVAKAKKIEKKETDDEVTKESENEIKKMIGLIGTEIERRQNKGELEALFRIMEQKLGIEQLKIEGKEEIKDKDKQERSEKEGLREKLRKNDGIVEFEEDMEIEDDNEELTEKKELTEEEHNEKELTEEEMLQLAIEESQNEEMLKMELEEKKKNENKEQENNNQGQELPTPSPLVVDLNELTEEQQVLLAMAMSENETLTKEEIDQFVNDMKIDNQQNEQEKQNESGKVDDITQVVDKKDNVIQHENSQEEVLEIDQDVSNLDTVDLGWHLSQESAQNAVVFEAWYADGTLITQEKSGKCTVVTSEILDKSSVYSFSCSFSKPLNGVKGITVGLIDGKLESKDKIGNNYYGSCFGEGAINVTQGELLNGDSLCTALTKIKFKVCIGSKVFQISDSSDVNVNLGQANEINQDGEYRLAIEFDFPGNDLDVLVSRAKKDKDEIEE